LEKTLQVDPGDKRRHATLHTCIYRSNDKTGTEAISRFYVNTLTMQIDYSKKESFQNS